MIKNVQWSSCKVPFILVRFSGKFFFSKNTNISNFMKICPVGAELFARGHIEGRTDMTTLVVAFRNLTNAPKDAW